MTLTPNEAMALDELEWELAAPHTLEEIATHLGCSLRHVSRIEARALKKLRDRAPDEWRAGLREPPLLGRSTRRTDFGSDCKTPDSTYEER